MNKLLKTSLLPFAILYKSVTSFRNYLYDIGHKKSVHFEVASISVGNLTVGGTGKTPHVEYLIRLLKDKFKLATLSRGYGRKTKGFILADDNASAIKIGDEPMQFYLKFKDQIKVAVGEERILAIPAILNEVENIEVILLDDAYQHRKVERDLNILVTDYNNPFYLDDVLPAGRLRESRAGAQRADVVVVSKCPKDLSPEETRVVEKGIIKYTLPNTPVFFSTILYGNPVPIFSEEKGFKGQVLLVSGIARGELMEIYVKENYNFFKHLKFKDHHYYTGDDIKLILKEFDSIKGGEKVILTTEKDMVKLRSAIIVEDIKNYPIYYLPIQVEFVKEKEKFDQLIMQSIDKRLKEIGK